MLSTEFVHESGPIVARAIEGGIGIYCHPTNFTHSVMVGEHKGNPDDPALIAKARQTVDRLGRYPDQVRKAYGLL